MKDGVRKFLYFKKGSANNNLISCDVVRLLTRENTKKEGVSENILAHGERSIKIPVMGGVGGL